MWRVIVGLAGLARRYPLVPLSFVLSLSAELVAGWLQITRQAQPYTDPRGPAIAQAVGVLGLVFQLPMMWIAMGMLSIRHMPLMSQTQDDERGQLLSIPLLVRMAQLPIKWQIVGYVAWSALLFLALAQLVTAIAGDLDHSSTLGTALAFMNLGGIFLVIIVRTSLPA